MASFAWGTTALNVKRDSYVPPFAEAIFTKIPLVPDPAALSAVCAVTQQGGRGPDEVSMTLVSYTYSEYLTFKNDWYAGTQRTFTGADSYSETMFIVALTPPTRKLYPLRFEYTLTLREVA